MASINKVIIVGRLGQDPEVRQFQNGGSLTSINVATSERWTDKNTGEQKEQTEWHRISLFNRLGEIAAQFLHKGSLVYIEGSLHTRKYTDQQGIERYSTEVRANQMQMLERRDNNQGGQGYYDNRGSGGYHSQNHQGGSQGGYQGGGYGGNNFANQGGAHQGGFNNQPQNGFGQNTPNYPNNNINQGFGQPHSNQNPNQPIQGGQIPASYDGQDMNAHAPSAKNNNPYMDSREKAAPKAVTPPASGGVADDDMPF